jgi:hypothetical protein
MAVVPWSFHVQHGRTSRVGAVGAGRNAASEDSDDFVLRR